MRILVMEDSPTTRAFVRGGLEAEGHDVYEAGGLASARGVLAEMDMDVIIADRMLPDGDGLDLIRELRERGDHTPVICLTNRSRVDERVEGLRSGVDDYLVKPFAFEELLARIHAITRRHVDEGDLVVGPLRLDTVRHVVEVEGRAVDLTAREFSLLAVFAQNAGAVMSRAKLLAAVWGVDFDTQTNVVDVYVGYLRQKLGPGIIHTIRGRGYVLEPGRR